MIALLAAVSFAAGFIDSIAGGGGLLLLPALLLSGLPPQLAMGTNKFASTFGTGAALTNYIRHGKVVWRIGALGIFLSLGASMLGSRAVLHVDEQVVGRMVVLLLPIAILATLARKPSHGEREPSTTRIFLVVPVVCAALGFYDGFFGPGTGSFFILAFTALLGLDFVRASATTKFFNLASNLGALVVFTAAGKVSLIVGIPLALANIAGNQFGSTLALRRGAGLVRVFLVVSLSVLLATLGLKYFR
jgi:hypothetical protein